VDDENSPWLPRVVMYLGDGGLRTNHFYCKFPCFFC